MALFYKKSEDGHIVVDDAGLPIVIDDEKPEGEQEFGLDAIHLIEKIPTLQEEAKNHRLKAKEASEKLKAFLDAGITDPKKAAEALQIAQNLSVGDLQKKEEVERYKKEMDDAWGIKFDNLTKSHQEMVAEKEQMLQQKDYMLNKVLLSSQFAKSPYFTGAEPLTKLTPEIAEAYFSQNFKIENVNGNLKTVGYIGDKPVYSKTRPGELAEFDEAMGRIIESSAQKDAILIKSNGSGAGGGSGTYRGQVIKSGDREAFGRNLEAIAKGEIQVV